jgi:hypothetical protein
MTMFMGVTLLSKLVGGIWIEGREEEVVVSDGDDSCIVITLVHFRVVVLGLTLILSVFKNMSLDPIRFHEGSKERSGRCDSKEIEASIFLHMNIREGASYKIFLVTFIVWIGEGVLKTMSTSKKSGETCLCSVRCADAFRKWRWTPGALTA